MALNPSTKTRFNDNGGIRESFGVRKESEKTQSNWWEMHVAVIRKNNGGFCAILISQRLLQLFTLSVVAAFEKKGGFKPRKRRALVGLYLYTYTTYIYINFAKACT